MTEKGQETFQEIGLVQRLTDVQRQMELKDFRMEKQR